MFNVPAVISFGFLAAILPMTASAQSAELRRNSVSVMAGQFMNTYIGHGEHPYATIRASCSLNRFFEAELGVGHARVVTTLYSIGETIRTYDAHTPFTAADVAFIVRAPWERFSPYAGISAGLMKRGESKVYEGLAASGNSVGIAAGARLMVKGRVGLRGEMRIRGDKYHEWRRGSNAEQSVGIVYRF